MAPAPARASTRTPGIRLDGSFPPRAQKPAARGPPLAAARAPLARMFAPGRALQLSHLGQSGPILITRELRAVRWDTWPGLESAPPPRTRIRAGGPEPARRTQSRPVESPRPRRTAHRQYSRERQCHEGQRDQDSYCSESSAALKGCGSSLVIAMPVSRLGGEYTVQAHLAHPVRSAMESRPRRLAPSKSQATESRKRPHPKSEEAPASKIEEAAASKNHLHHRRISQSRV